MSVCVLNCENNKRFWNLKVLKRNYIIISRIAVVLEFTAS